MKTLKKLAFISLALGMVSSGLIASVAWFVPGTNSFTANISGSVVEEYFHCGKGTQDDPFVITRPVHYYHLTEFFQRETVLNVSRTESVTFGTDYLYFQVGYPLKDNDSSLYVYDYDNTGAYTGTITTPAYSKTLNLSYFSGENALMPIGTNEVPFFGSFDGGAQSTASNGITISNLNIKTSDTVVVGNTTTNRSTSDAGVFGYVADQKDASHKTVIANAYFDNLTIDLSGVSGTVVSDANHIDAHTDNAVYVGYIVGHMHTYTNYDSTGPTNASPIHDVYINNAKIEGGANSKCSFGYVGYADTIDGHPGSEYDLGNMIGTLEEEAGKTNDFGGSIDMENLYNRINYVKSEMNSTYDSSRITGYNFAGKYNVLQREGNREETINFLSGGNTANSTEYYSTSQSELYGIDFSTTQSTDESFYISCVYNSTTYYLSLNTAGNDLEATTSKKTLWRLSSGHSDSTHDNYIYSYSNLTFPIGYENTTSRYSARFLSVDSNNYLYVTTTAKTQFDKTNNKIYLHSTTKFISYNGAWVIEASTSQNLYRIKADSNYVAVDTTNIALKIVSSRSDAVVWNLIANGNYGYKISTTINGSAYYWYDNRSPYTILLNKANSTNYDGWGTYSSSSLRNKHRPPQNGDKIGGGTTGTTSSKCAYYYQGEFYCKSNGKPNNMVHLVFDIESVTYYESLCVDVQNLSQIEWSTPSYVDHSETYIPINIQHGSIEAKDNTNVGYICSGSNYRPDDATLNRGDLRVSEYPYSSISASVASSDATNISFYTINGSGKHTISDTLSADDTTTAKTTIDNLGFVRYYDQTVDEKEIKGARDQFYDVISTNRISVYGLHFMDAAISYNNKFVATNLKINENNNIASRELPRDCIDFVVKKDGYITFFAGTYFQGNNTFFSLHEIKRDGSGSITSSSITEINKIYRKASDNSIAYGDSVPSGDTELFDTSWITSPGSNFSQDSIYYFEIPVKAGEYALGSVNEKNGAYLMYLDIGSNGEGDEPIYNTENKISDDPILTQMEYLSNGYVINSCFNIGFVIPAGATKENFWIIVSRNGDVFAVEVVNQTSAVFEIDILLVDNDDDPTNPYPYTYTLKYNDGSVSDPYNYSASFTGAVNGTQLVRQTS